MMLQTDGPNRTYAFILRGGITQEIESHHGRGGVHTDVSMHQKALMMYNSHPTESRLILGGTSSTDILTPGSACIL